MKKLVLYPLTESEVKKFPITITIEREETDRIGGSIILSSIEDVNPSVEGTNFHNMLFSGIEFNELDKSKFPRFSRCENFKDSYEKIRKILSESGFIKNTTIFEIDGEDRIPDMINIQGYYGEIKTHPGRGMILEPKTQDCPTKWKEQLSSYISIDNKRICLLLEIGITDHKVNWTFFQVEEIPINLKLEYRRLCRAYTNDKCRCNKYASEIKHFCYMHPPKEKSVKNKMKRLKIGKSSNSL